MTPQDLVFDRQLSDVLSLYTLNNLPMLKIETPLCQAALCLHGGHLVHFQPINEAPLLWLSDLAEFTPSTSIRGGVPICWPWFGKIGTPSHGFARTSRWSLLDYQQDGDQLKVRLQLQSSAETLSVWSHQFNAILTFTFTERVRIELTVTNTDEGDWCWSGALHSYLNVGEAEQTTVTQMGTAFLNSLEGNQAQNGEDNLVIDQSIDRIYTAPQDHIKVRDTVYRRYIHVHNQGHNAAVIWNPWVDITKSMADMPDDGYKHMVCVESTHFAPTLQEGMLLSPGQSHTLITEIAAEQDAA